jgi:hypothetical protein
VWSGVCVNEGKPGREVCNNKDDDCNGLVDDNVSDLQACSLTLGVCAGAKNRCESGGQLACEAADYGANYERVEARCDGFDNDCDGFTDVKSAVTLAMDTGTAFQLLPVPGGFVMVFERRPTSGTAELVVSRYDEQLAFLRNTVVARPPPLFFHARAVGDLVYVIGTVDGGVDVTRVNTLLPGGADGGLEHFEPLADAGFTSGLRLGVAEQVVSTFLAAGDTRARMATWQLDGGLSQVKDLNAGPGVPATTVLNSTNVSDRGHFVIYSADNSAGDTVRELVRLGDGGVWNPPYYGGVESELIEWDAGVSATYPYSSTNSSLSGIYHLPDLTRGLTEVAAGASNLAQEWAAMSAVRSPAGDVTIAMQQRIAGGAEQLVLATSVPVANTFTFRSRNLAPPAPIRPPWRRPCAPTTRALRLPSTRP